MGFIRLAPEKKLYSFFSGAKRMKPIYYQQQKDSPGSVEFSTNHA